MNEAALCVPLTSPGNRQEAYFIGLVKEEAFRRACLLADSAVRMIPGGHGVSVCVLDYWVFRPWTARQFRWPERPALLPKEAVWNDIINASGSEMIIDGSGGGPVLWLVPDVGSSCRVLVDLHANELEMRMFSTAASFEELMKGAVA